MSMTRTPGGDEIREGGGQIGLALSGGGLKAAVFHIGVLARLAELDLLRRIDVISGTSGGALIAALYHLRVKRALDAGGDVGSDRLIRMVAAVERDFLAVVQTDLRARLFENPLTNLKRMSSRHSSAMRLGDLLERHLFRPIWNGDPSRPIEMRDLLIHPRGDRDFNPIIDNSKRFCKAPALIISATNLDTGRAWRFDAERMGEPASGPAARRISKAPLLAKSPYRRLPEHHAGIALGNAVAASMAAPGLLEPLPLHQLYPDPKRPSRFLRIRLADGRLADPLGTDALVERGCSRLIISDGGGFGTVLRGINARAQARQLETLERTRPSGIVLIHMLDEIEAPEVRPVGPIGRGHVADDRTDLDATSYGVERRMQKLIAGMRVDFDAPSEIEAMSLMADGYLVAKRVFQRQRLRGQSWAEGGMSADAEPWRFTAMIDALGQPSKKLIRHLSAARLSAFKAPRLLMSHAFDISLLVLAGTLTLIALAAFWSGIRPAAGADRLWGLASVALLMLVAWLAGRQFGDDHDRIVGLEKGWINAILSRIVQASAIVTALPLSVGAALRQRVSRAFLKAGRLKSIGIMPAITEKRSSGATGQMEPATTTERKAA